LALSIFYIHKKEGMKIRNIFIFLIIGILIALPWLIHIWPSIQRGTPEPREYSLGPTEGIEMIYYRFGLLPLFAIFSLYSIIKEKRSGFIFIFWGVSLFIIGQLLWKNRFYMEFYLPFNFFIAYGLVFTVEKGLDLMRRKNPLALLFFALIIGVSLNMTDLLLFQPTRYTTFEVEEYNLEAMNWIRENTGEDVKFYASTISSYIGYIIIYTEREVINYPILSSAEDLSTSPSHEELYEIEKPEIFGGEFFYSVLLKNNVTHIYVFNKNGMTEWRNAATGERTFIKKDEILAQRSDLYEVVYENKYVKIYKIIKKLRDNYHKFVA
jgi:hypothetical protein